MSAELPQHAAAGYTWPDAARRRSWSPRDVFLVDRAIWYARPATVPLIVAALISTQLLPLVAWAAASHAGSRSRAASSGSCSSRQGSRGAWGWGAVTVFVTLAAHGTGPAAAMGGHH